MTSLIIIFTALSLWGVIHSFLATNRVKSWVKETNINLFYTYRLIYNIFSLISFLPISYLVVGLSDTPIYQIPSPWVLISLLIQIVSGILMVVAFRQTGISNFLGIRILGKQINYEDDRMVTDGLYRIVRHPLYILGLIILWLNPFMTLNRLIFSLTITIYVLIGAVFEEKRLEANFGSQYKKYKMKTPMFIPKLKFNR